MFETIIIGGLLLLLIASVLLGGLFIGGMLGFLWAAGLLH
jgi:hypothetical protein